MGSDFVICASPKLMDTLARLEDAYAAARAGTTGERVKSEEWDWIKRFGPDGGLPLHGRPTATLDSRNVLLRRPRARSAHQGASLEAEKWEGFRLFACLQRFARAALGKTGRPSRLDTATRMATDADFRARKEPAAPPHDPPAELSPIDELMRIVGEGTPRGKIPRPAKSRGRFPAGRPPNIEAGRARPTRKGFNRMGLMRL